MATVHTEYGPGKITDRETVRGRTRFKVAGEGFEVWLDAAKLGGLPPEHDGLSDSFDDSGEYYPGREDEVFGDYPSDVQRRVLRQPADESGYGPFDGDDDAARYSSRRTSSDYSEAESDYDEDYEPEDLHGLRHRLRVTDSDEDDAARYSYRQALTSDEYADRELHDILNDDPYSDFEEGHPGHPADYGFDHGAGTEFDDDPDRHFAKRANPGKGEAHLAWAPMDNDNSTELPYNPHPQHDAIGTPGDDNSSTIQPIHHIDADERLTPSNSITFDEGSEGGPGPSRELFAGIGKEAIVPSYVLQKVLQHPKTKELAKQYGPQVLQHVVNRIPGLENVKVPDNVHEHIENAADKAHGVGKAVGDYGMGHLQGVGVGMGINRLNDHIDRALTALSPVNSDGTSGWGDLIKSSGIHEANPLLLALPAVGEAALGLAGRAAGGMALNGLMDRASEAFNEGGEGGEGDGWGDLTKSGSSRPAGLSDKYIDLTASVDYWNDPVAQFRHDPEAYINRIGHLMDEGLNPRFAEYMELVDGDASIRTAAWKDVRKKAMRLKREGHVSVKDIAHDRIMASVTGDHGVYDVMIKKGGAFSGFDGGHGITNWHCACEWGKWAFRRKYTYVGRLCSHAYASYLTMQSAHLKGKPRQRKRADNLQNGPERLTPELVINDADDAHMFLDVTKDERKDVGPDDVISEKDIVHFARMMRHCEVTEQPYPRQLVAFLSRYSGCSDDSSDDTQADYKAHDATDANEYLTKIRDDADRKQENDFGSMADRVHSIQDAVEEARAHGADADRFVAMVRTAEPFITPAGPDRDIGIAKIPQYQMNFNMRSPFVRQEDKDAGFAKFPQFGLQNPFGGGESSGASNGDSDGPARNPIRFDKQNDAEKNYINNPDQFRNDFGKAFGKDAPAAPPGPGQAQPQLVGDTQPKGGDGGAGKGGDGGAGKGGDGGAGGGQTSGTIADGGVAGAENGNNAAITKNMLDADGNYTVGKGDTWSDIAQRTTGDMNNYQKMYDVNKGVAGGNIDSLAEGTKINLKDFANETGNNGMAGNITNPAGGGADGNMATVDAVGAPSAGDDADAVGSSAVAGNNAGTSIGMGAGDPVDTGAAGGTSTGGGAETGAITPPPTPAPGDTGDANKAGAGGIKTESSAKWWLQRMADATHNHGADAPTDPSQPQTPASTTPTSTTPTSPTPATPGAASPAAQPAANPATGAGTGADPNQKQVQPNPETETYDPQNPASQAQQQTSTANPGADAGGSGNQFDMNGIGDMIGQGVGAASDLVSGIGSAIGGGGLSGVASGISNGIGTALSMFSSKQDLDDFIRYAYPTADGEGDLEPHTHPFAGSGYPGPLEIGTSEEYADRARAKADDVTDLGSGDLTQPMGDWQKQGSREEDLNYLFGHGHVNNDGTPKDDHDDDSDIVRSFQANLGETALGAGAGGGGGRYDDFSSAAQGFLRTAGRNYSMAEQSELIREGDKGGARNLASLDLSGTHYEDMDSLGW